ncbi:hypothetical protein GGX14DRAFT_595303 [Mycena pura]|uniref:Uncharacterized protein n=1 Tax=Mycena pura TaxID=153505 RepID=A0AAD6VSW4_9AGAR|nr:hypothetical protein GGX14DRAFT_595303 [Mycena pura]
MLPAILFCLDRPTLPRLATCHYDTPSISVLTTEVLEQIVDVSKENRKTLGACGLAGRQFLPRTRLHLFASIALGSPRIDISRRGGATYPTDLTRCDVLLDILRANPVLALHVAELVLTEGGHPNLTVFWISESTTLVPVVNLLHNLQSFSIRCVQALHCQVRPVLATTLQMCIARPFVRSIEIAALEVYDVGALFAAFDCDVPGRVLDCLRLSDVTFAEDWDANDAPSAASPLVVHALNAAFHFEDPDQGQLLDILSGPLPLIAISRVHHLRLTVGHDLDMFRKWLELTAPSLEQLDLRFVDDTILLDTVTDAVQNPPTLRLRVLSLEESINAVSKCFDILNALLAPDLREITLRLRPGNTFNMDHCRPIIVSLITHATELFPRLTRVRLDLGQRFSDKWHEDLLDLCEDLEVYKSGLLVVVVRIFVCSREIR